MEARQELRAIGEGHRPDICFPAAGAKLVDDFGRVTLVANGVALNFRHLTFASGAKLLHVFYCLWSDKISPHEKPIVEDVSQTGRIQAVMQGERNLGQRVLEIVVTGPDSSDAAVEILKAQLPLLVKRD